MKNKLVHVNAYTKQDGTHVKEHYRGGGSSVDGNRITEGTVLHGSVVEYEYIPPSSSKVGDIISTAADIAAGTIPVVIAIGKALAQKNAAEAARIKPIISEYINHLGTTQKYLQQTLDASLKQLGNAKNPTEYTELYKKYAKDLEIYNKSHDAYNRIKYLTEHGSYTQLQEELENYCQNIKSQTIKAPNVLEDVNINDLYSGYSNRLEYSKNLVNDNTLLKSTLKNVNNTLNAKYPDARQFMDIALTIPDYVPVSDNYTIIPSALSDMINSNFKLDNLESLKIPQNWSGLSFNENSSISKNLSESSQLQDFVRNEYKKNNFDTDKLFGLSLDKDVNLHYSIGHATILNPHIDNDGYFRGILYDKYDYEFNWDYYSNLTSPGVLGTILNNLAFVLQKFKKLGNFYVLIPIEFKW